MSGEAAVKKETREVIVDTVGPVLNLVKTRTWPSPKLAGGDWQWYVIDRRDRRRVCDVDAAAAPRAKEAVKGAGEAFDEDAFVAGLGGTR